MQDWFKSWFNSPYYHILYKNRSQQEADDFVQQLVDTFMLQNKTLLDVACGKGRHAQAFAKHAIDVTGIDLSEESILHAKQYETDDLHFYVHDMRNVFRTNYYHVVTNLFTSFGYFKQSHDNDLVAHAICKALKPKGQFIIDFVNKEYAHQVINEKNEEHIQHDTILFHIKKSYTDSQLLKEINITDGSKKLQYCETVNTFTEASMKSIFAKAGLTHKETFGNYALQAYDAIQSPRMIMLFEK